MEAMLWINSYGMNTFESITYERAMELFLTEFPDGEVRLDKRHLAGYIVTSRANLRCPWHVGLKLSDSEEEEKVLKSRLVKILMLQVACHHQKKL